MRDILAFSLWLLLLFSISCTSQRDAEWLLHALSSGREDSEVRELVRKHNFSLEDTLNALWSGLLSEDIKKKKAADFAFARISRGRLFSPRTFDIGEATYWHEITEFHLSKYIAEENEEMKQLAAIYLRQIRRPESELLADKLGVPRLKELTGVELEDDRL